MISAVIPAYNEEDNIFPAAEAISAALSGEDFELIFVDDGSTDATWERICAASEKFGARGIRFSRNFGKEPAIRAGLEESAGDAVVVIDCDLQHPPEVIPKMISEWRNGAEAVIGKKSARGRESKGYGFLAHVFNSMMSRATGFDMSGASDFMLLDRKVVGAILEYGERGSFFRALAQFVGFRTAEVGYEVAARKNGKGTWTLKKLIKYAVSNLASFTTAPLLAGLFFGVICLLAGAVLLILRAAGIPLGSFSAAVSVMIIISGLVLVCLGISGYYLSKIYDEIKHRPRYHIAAKVNERKDNNER